MNFLARTGRVGSLFLILLIGILFSTHAAAASLKGIVQGSSGAPKGYVQVDAYGPENKRTFTDQNGKFIMNLREGDYTIQISERDRVEVFKVSIASQGLEKTFVIKWR